MILQLIIIQRSFLNFKKRKNVDNFKNYEKNTKQKIQKYKLLSFVWASDSEFWKAEMNNMIINS